MTVFPTSGYPRKRRPPRTSVRTEAPLRLISQTTGTATLIEWAKLALGDGNTQVLRVARVRQDTAFGTLVEQIVLPLDKFPGLTDGDTVTYVAELAERLACKLQVFPSGSRSWRRLAMSFDIWGLWQEQA